MQHGSQDEADIGVKFFEHVGSIPITVQVHAKRVGRINYRNKINIYKLEKGLDKASAKLSLYGITIRTAQVLFNLGDVKLLPGDSLYAQVQKRGLEFSAVERGRTLDYFTTLFE